MKDHVHQEMGGRGKIPYQRRPPPLVYLFVRVLGEQTGCLLTDSCRARYRHFTYVALKKIKNVRLQLSLENDTSNTCCCQRHYRNSRSRSPCHYVHRYRKKKSRATVLGIPSSLNSRLKKQPSPYPHCEREMLHTEGHRSIA